jgi:chemotaxis protein CheC
MNDQVLTEEQLDVLSELFNIGIGQAAASLSEMIDDNVDLSVPVVRCLPLDQASIELAKMTSSDISAVKQMFSGEFSGNALLIFPERDSLELVKAILGSDVSLEYLSELEEDALLEVGNVILNACICTISDILGCEIIGDIPTRLQGDCKQILSMSSDDVEESYMLLLSMLFSIPNHDIKGSISFIMNMGALQKFITLIDQYVEKLMSL